MLNFTQKITLQLYQIKSILFQKNNNILLSTPSLFLNKNGKTITFLENNLRVRKYIQS